MLTALLNAEIYTGDEVVKGKALLYEEGKIIGLVLPDQVPNDSRSVDCSGLIVAPGLIDLQIYGAGGVLFSARPESKLLYTMADALMRSGTTGFLVTLATNSLDVFDRAADVVNEATPANLLGIHFEGPYLNPLRKGAHPEQYIRQPQLQEIRSLLKRNDGHLRMMTIAAERFDKATLDELISHNVVLSIGHSNASYEEAVKAFGNGVSCATHLFNAMASMHHREPGLCAAIFQTPGVFTSIVADGVHVDFRMIAIAKKLLGERLFLITDAVEESNEGPYRHIKKDNRFTLPDGTLSGSSLTMLKAVKNCVEHVGISLEEALRMGSTYPAMAIGSKDRGRIAAGCRADLLLLTRDLDLRAVIFEGQKKDLNVDR